ncbi:DUF58 domain-containing protein [Nocardia seriolae]|uniref:DUF58 domain-containing protein n=1 Tax=Nocardia seriolae TaxID=37332 RepID=A0A0B8N8B2_9NOCA|nr:DUF58 domain-containing protein [Nocardia seriolae]APA94745.1 hypothetical protein NS506_00666 [Nocardia seriolae]MTJ60040.1 DUF58 domain-containing protein [Nocardia seriolae]MTJ70110.1 DUF58 domain-containing protein [Nocardia seriolae]MTJ85042.1 DUF58 domain-containing protein [Nocardia seriolae]MTK29037.1 DUF58 domain-containing protein [Nocardia seriolae]
MVVTGRLAAAAVLAALFVTLALPSWLGVAIATLVLVALIAVDLALLGSPGALELSRDPITTVRAGRGIEVELAVLNTGARPVRGTLWDDWPPSAHPRHRTHALNLPSNTRIRLHTELTPDYHGDRPAGPVTIRLLGPLGMAGRQVRREVPARLRALPPFRSERILASKVKQLQQLEGRNTTVIRGQGTEFDSFREYVAGDDVRTIDWRATARANDVLVRTWRPERNRHVVMLLDTGRVSAGRVGDGTRLDATIEAALLLGGLAAAGGDSVDLLAYDRRIRTEVRGIGGKRLQLKLMHALAGLTPELVDTDYRGLLRATLQRARRRSLVVWFTHLDAATVQEGLRPVLPVLAERHRVLVVSVTDPEVAAAATRRSGLDDLYAAAAAENVIAEHAVARETLRRMGVRVIAAAPDQLPGALADEYLELKQTGAL